MKVATWNINSIRIRLEAVSKFVKTNQPDIICFQETKTEDAYFPVQSLLDLGFGHYLIRGEKSYNGMAIFSKLPLTPIPSISFVEKNDSRHIAVMVDNIELHNFYIPAGGDIPDPALNPKFDHKLKFIDEMSVWFKKNRCKDDRIILVGDLNVAPLEHDVWSHKQLLKIVSHTPVEVEKLQALQNSLHFVDAVRKFVPESEKLYSWWSYRNHDWKKSNRGRRLDHIWVTSPLVPLLKRQFICREARDYTSPSDHVPVMVEMSHSRA